MDQWRNFGKVYDDLYQVWGTFGPPDVAKYNSHEPQQSIANSQGDGSCSSATSAKVFPSLIHILLLLCMVLFKIREGKVPVMR